MPEPPPGSILEYLRTAPPAVLEEFELNRPNHVANLQKESSDLFDRMVTEMAEAHLARMLLERRKGLFGLAKRDGSVAKDRLPEITEEVFKMLTAAGILES